MTNIKLKGNFVYLAIFILLLIFIVSISISYSSLVITHPELAVGITFDLALTAPLLYLFLIWKTKVPKTTVIPFFVLNTIIASYLIPVDQQFYLSQIKTFVIPVVEIGGIGFLVWNVYRMVRAYKSEKSKDSDILNILYQTSLKIFGIPVIARLLAFELAVIYYVFLSWKKPKLDKNKFTYHKNSGKLALFGIIIFILVAETTVIHFLLEDWNFYIAWIMTLSSGYVSLQLLAHLKAVYQRPIEVIGDKLFIRYGLFCGAEIELENIAKVQVSSIKPTEMDNVKQVALIGDFEQFNIIIQLKQDAIFSGFYGNEDKFKTLLLFVDETKKFKRSIKINEYK